jgi:hypothetical protein
MSDVIANLVIFLALEVGNKLGLVLHLAFRTPVLCAS